MVSMRECKKIIKENTDRSLEPNAYVKFQELSDELISQFAKLVMKVRNEDTRRESKISTIHVENAWAKFQYALLKGEEVNE